MIRKPMVQTAAMLAMLAALAFGCAGAPLQETGNSDARSVYVIEPGIKGRGCLYTRVQQFGEGKSDVEVIVAQDGTSDWSLTRAFAFLGEAVAAVFGGGERKQDGIGAPDPLQGCSQLFETPQPTAAPPQTTVVEPVVEFTVDDGEPIDADSDGSSGLD